MKPVLVLLLILSTMGVVWSPHVTAPPGSSVDANKVQGCLKLRTIPSSVQNLGAEEASDEQWFAFCTCRNDGSAKPTPRTCWARHFPEGYRKTSERSCLAIYNAEPGLRKQSAPEYCACQVEEEMDKSLNGAPTRKWNCQKLLPL
jgi:hypothetical protein